MKRLKLNLALLMVVLGTGVAFAGAGKYQAETVYFGSDNQWHNIPSGKGVQCDGQNKNCTGTGTVSNPLPTARRGNATLIDL